MTRFPLESISVAAPCSADWSQMQGDDAVRFCAECGKHVYNLSALPRVEALKRVEETEGKLCVRFYRRADGTLLTADCPVGVHHRVRRSRRRHALLAGFATLMLASGCTRDAGGVDDESAPIATPHAIEAPENHPPVMGKICLAPAPAGAGQPLMGEPIFIAPAQPMPAPAAVEAAGPVAEQLPVHPRLVPATQPGPIQREAVPPL